MSQKILVIVDGSQLVVNKGKDVKMECNNIGEEFSRQFQHV